MKTETLICLLAGEDPTPMHRHLAERRVAQLLALARVDKREMVAMRLMSRQTIARLASEFRAASLAPVRDAQTLAEIAEAVGADSRVAMAKVLWVLNSAHYSTLERVEAQSEKLITDALHLAR